MIKCPRCRSGRLDPGSYCRTCGYAPNVGAGSRLHREATVLEERWMTDPHNRSRFGSFLEEQARDSEASARLIEQNRERAATLFARSADTLARLPSSPVLNAAGFELSAGERCEVVFLGSAIEISRPSQAAESVPWSELREIEITGPGTVTSGGGFIGGGIGLEGAAEGMLMAGVLNAISTKSKVQTVVGLLFISRELWLLHDVLEPLALRIELAPVFAHHRQLQMS